MTEKRKQTFVADRRADGPKPEETADRIDRRGFVRGAAMLTVGGFGTRAAFAQQDPSGVSQAGAPTADAEERLATQIQRAQRWGGRDPADWVRPRSGVDHNVVILGGGQSGLAIAYGLKRLGVGGVEIIDRAEPGLAGIWRNTARMHQLRTPKTLRGPEQENPILSFQAWYELLNGPDAYDALDRIPTLAWADYLDWYQQINGIEVRYRTNLLGIEPQGDLVRLQLESDGERRVETTRKLVLANGYAGAGGPNVPGFLRALPAEFWTHTASPFREDAFAGKIIAIVGAGSSAFDAAAVALESGAAEVHVFNRRPYVGYPAPRPPASPAPDRGHANVLALSYELPDAVRWRNFVSRERGVATVPMDSIERVMAFDNFRIHLESSLADVRIAAGRVAANSRGESWQFDHVIAGTGYRIDLSAQPELAGIHESIALWRDRYEPEPGEDNAAAAIHPYLGPGFEFLARDGTDADYLRNIHCFNLSAMLSFGKPVGDIPSVADHPRLVMAIARDLYRESVDTEVHRVFFNSPAVPQDPAPYQRAVQGRVQAAA